MIDAALSFRGVGGPILAVLLVLSLISVTVIIVKAAALWRVRGGAAARAEALRALKSGDTGLARRALESGRTPADRIAIEGISMLEAGAGKAALEKDLMLRGNAAVAGFYSHLRILELIAMISPLLGLLGTVLGMIQSFQELELAEGAANAALLAGGIWQALLTTAAGLVVAIPAAAGAALLSARADAAAGDIEQAIGAVLVAREGDGASS